MSNTRTTTAARNAKKAAAEANANVFDLDALSREDVGIEVKEPMVARLKGITFTMADPGEMDFTQVSQLRMTSEGSRVLFGHMVGDEAIFEKIMDPSTGPVEQWKLWALMQKWTEHYEFELRSAPEGNGSPQL